MGRCSRPQGTPVSPQPLLGNLQKLGEGERLPRARSCCGSTHAAVFHHGSICAKRYHVTYLVRVSVKPS